MKVQFPAVPEIGYVLLPILSSVEAILLLSVATPLIAKVLDELLFT